MLALAAFGQAELQRQAVARVGRAQRFLLLDLAFRLVPDLSLEAGPSRFFTVSAATIVTASLSWLFLEAPIARLKRAFPVATPPSAPLVESGVAVSPDAA